MLSFSQIDKKCKIFNYVIENSDNNFNKYEKKGILEAIEEYLVYGVYLEEFQEITGLDIIEVEKECFR